jgi:hypothetical protein
MAREEEPELTLAIPDRCLAVFVDDTGHEDFPEGHPVYGLGGCASAGTSNASLKGHGRRYGGALKVRLMHSFTPASSQGAQKTEDMEAVARFFREPFWRFGAVLTKETKIFLREDIGRIKLMKVVLQERIQDIVQTTLCKEVKVIFEASERTDKLVQEAFQDFEVHRGSKRIPSECYFMPKSAASPAMEVADFVMHSVGRQARHNLTWRGTFLPHFCAVFHAANPDLMSFREVDAVVRGFLPEPKSDP